MAAGTVGVRTIWPKSGSRVKCQKVGRNVPGRLRPSNVNLSPSAISPIPTKAMNALRTSLAPSPIV